MKYSGIPLRILIILQISNFKPSDPFLILALLRGFSNTLSNRAEKAELLPGFPKLRMEPVSFRGIKMDFGFVEKVLVILHGLPVLDHSGYASL
ncbi:MAG: hypothetical protein HFH49_01420 [Lachnospiraceae bacterium]|nr:hypothetical protein [Lachnospiraceae bacterium]